MQSHLTVVFLASLIYSGWVPLLNANSVKVDPENLGDAVGQLFDIVASSKKDRVEKRILLRKIDTALEKSDLSPDQRSELKQAKRDGHLTKDVRDLLRPYLNDDEKDRVSDSTLSDHEESLAKSNLKRMIDSGTQKQFDPTTGTTSSYYGKWLEHILERRRKYGEVDDFTDYVEQRDHVEKCHVCNSMARLALASTGIRPIELAVELPSEQVQLNFLWYHIDKRTGSLHLLNTWWPNAYSYRPESVGRLVKHADGQWYAIPRMFGPTIGPLIFPPKGAFRFK